MTPQKIKDLAPGTIEFYDNALPPLLPGDYTINWTQTLSGSNSFTQSIQKTQPFKVYAPRFQLDPNDIYSLFPSLYSNGQYEEYVPYVILKKPALPWSREIVEGNPAIPWMALIVFAQSELLIPTGGDPLSPTKIVNLTNNDLQNPPPADTFFPPLKLNDLDDPQMGCQVIEMLPQTFIDLFPRLEELRFLSFSLQVNTDDKIMDNAAVQGWFSAVMSNRLPPQPPAGQASAPYIAHLVSLEGFVPYLTTAPDFGSSARVRCVSLASWAFTCQMSQGENFADLALGLLDPSSEQGTQWRLVFPLPSTPPLSNADPQSLVRNALGEGYVPLSYHTRAGEKTMAWYRSPLSAVTVAQLNAPSPFTSSAAAMVYDSTTGMFDQSYAVAWEIGRQMALSDKYFAGMMLGFRQSTQVKLSRLWAEQEMKQGEHLEAYKRGISHRYADDLLSTLGEISRAKVPGAQTFSPSTLKNKASSSISPFCINSLKNLYATADLPTMVAEDPTFSSICDWLSRLCLFYNMPFNILVPDARMLPPESIRFFYVDENAVRCMIDGACSIALHSSRDQVLMNRIRSPLYTAVKEKMSVYRSTLQGKTLPGSADGNLPQAGFLLRSSLVSGWPGLEVRAYAQVSGNNPSGDPLPVLRMDRLSPNVLLCLFSAVPLWVEIAQPQEGLHFGVEDHDLIPLKSVVEPAGTDLGITVQLAVRGLTRVMDVNALIAQIQTKLVGQLGSGGVLSPGDFALQMVKAPQRLVFEAPTNTSPQAMPPSFKGAFHA